MFQPIVKEHGPKFNKLLLAVFIGGALLLIGAIAAAGYYFKEYKTLKNDAGVAAESEQKRIVSKVEALYNTPDEDPSIIQVQDQAKVQKEAFFKESKKGDYVLIYQKAKTAILYREETNKIINTGPIVLDQETQNDATSPEGSTMTDTAEDKPAVSPNGTTQVQQ